LGRKGANKRYHRAGVEALEGVETVALSI